jgi:hypothetical protein
LELIQNAEDAFARGHSSSSLPFVTFNIYRDKIVVDCNENGFTEGDVQAICSTGESSKKGVVGYVGEKGIGFKSVFKVASRVHIQSGYFSFSFDNHADKEGLTGLGMVTPIPEPYEALPMNPLTRMTLYLSEKTKFEELVTQFEDLPDTILIFLQKLKALNFVIHTTADDIKEVSYSYTEDTSAIAKLTTTTNLNHVCVNKEIKLYHIIKSIAGGLPSDDARPRSETEIVLAFPLDQSFSPLLEPQFVYSFLPIRSVGFKVSNRSAVN